MQLYLGDCLEVLPTLPDKSVDMVMCDLPYGTTQNKWDSVIDLAALWAQYRRVCKGAIVLTASQPFTSQVVASNFKDFRYAWVWRKSSATGHLNAKRMPMKIHEDILVFSQETAPYYPQGLEEFGKVVKRGNNGTNFGDSGRENFQSHTNYPRSVLEFANDPKPVHPTQKPVALMEYLIRTYTNPGDVVLDNCAGSGSTGVAALQSGRQFIGIERELEYWLIAHARLSAIDTSVSTG